MSNPTPKYDEDFKKSIASLHQNGKTLSELSRVYGASISAMSKWVKAYAEVKIDEDTIMTAKQVKDLQKRNVMLEEENLILKKPLPRTQKILGGEAVFVKQTF